VSTYNRVVAADSSASLAPAVRARLATEMADPTSDVGASLSDTFATQGPLPQSTNIVGFAGDSITNASGASSNRGFVHLVRWIAGTRNVDQVIRVYATGGYTSAQVLATHIPSAVAGDAAVIHIQVGTNDAGTTVSVATFAANVTAMYDALRAAGKRMTIGLVPPRASGATTLWRQDRGAYNEWISRWAPLNGIPVADLRGLADSSGDLAAGYDSGDGTHPNDAGHAIIAAAVSTAVLSVLPTQPHRPSRAPDVNLMPLTATPSTTAAGMPSGWSEIPGGTGTAPTYYTIADTGGTLKEGTWAQMEFNATVGGTRSFKHGGIQNTVGWSSASGDQIEGRFTVEFEDVSGFTAALVAGTATIRLLIYNSANGPQVEVTPTIAAIIGKRHAYRFTAPTTTYPSMGITVTLPAGVHVKVRLGELQWVNLTGLGITKTTT